jgi:phytoene desaturase
LSELEHHNLFFVKKWQQNFDDIYKTRKWPDKASIYVCKPSATDASVAPKDHENVFVLVPLPAGVTKDNAQTAEFVQHYLEQLEHMSGVADLRQRIVVQEVRDPQYFGEAFHSWQYTALGMSHTLRQSAFLRPSVQSKKVKNLYYVGGGTQPGIGVPMCLISAELVYKAIIGDKSASPLKPLKGSH